MPHPIRPLAFVITALVLPAAPAVAAPGTAPLAHANCPDGQILDAARENCVAIAAADLGGGKLWWVDPTDGNDANDGTSGAPVRDVENLLENPAVFTPLPALGDDIVVVGAGMVRTDEVRFADAWRGTPTNRTYLIEYTLNREFFFDGANRDLNGGWELWSGNIWRRSWPWAALYTGPDHPALSDGGFETKRREAIFQDEVRALNDQYSRDLIDAPGEYYIEGWPDIQGAWVYAWFYDDADPNAHDIRSAASNANGFFIPYHASGYYGCGTTADANYVTLLGFGIRNSATMSHGRTGACAVSGMTYEDSEIYNHRFRGLTVRGNDTSPATNVTVRNNHLHHNGIGGVAGTDVDGALVEYNLVEQNSHRDVMWQMGGEGHESGGGKWLETVNSTFRYNHWRDNEGYCGLWLDHENDGNLIAFNRFTNNYRSALFFEIGSDDNVVYANLFVNNRYQTRAVTGWMNHGAVYVVSSARNLIAYNTFVGNGNAALAMREDSRWSWSSRTQGNALFNNLFIDTPNAVDAPGAFQTLKATDWFENFTDPPTNPSGGNLFHGLPVSPHELFNLRFDATTTTRGNDLSILTNFNGDDTSRLADPGTDYVVNAADPIAGWVPSVPSGLVGVAVTLPAGYGVSDADLTTDFFGNPRPTSVAQRHAGAAEADGTWPPGAEQPVVTPTHVLPGQIEAELYRDGGEGVGYHDTTPGNAEGGCRSDDVDLKDAGGGNCVVGFFDQGEWLAYAVRIEATGDYALRLRVASDLTGGSSLHLEIDGVDVSGPIDVPDTDAWDAFTEVSAAPIALTAGDVTLTVVNDGGFFDFDWLSGQLVGDLDGGAPSDGAPGPDGGPPGDTPSGAGDAHARGDGAADCQVDGSCDDGAPPGGCTCAAGGGLVNGWGWLLLGWGWVGARRVRWRRRA